MVRGVLYRKLARDILGSWGQSLAVAAVVLSGAALYVAMASSYRNLLLTRDAYYAQYRFADFFVSLERAPKSVRYRLEALPGVRQVRGRIVQDVSLDISGEDEPRTGRIVSMPDHREPVLNDIALLSGRYFEAGARNEVIVSDAFARENGLRPGDVFEASLATRKHTLRVVGTGLSPEYVYTIRGGSELIPDPAGFAILWVPETFAEQAFDMAGACNDFVGTVDDPAQTEAILDAAEDLLEPYGVFVSVGRKDQISSSFVQSEIEGVGVSATIIPAIFFGVAAMVLLVLLNRMVRQERMQIGLLKAYGYTNAAVAAHYVRYALILSLAGAVAGCGVGQWLAGRLMEFYRDFYSFPVLRSDAYPLVMLNALALSAGFGVAGAVAAARRAARIQPADAMRPETPRTAAHSLLERSAWAWGRLSFTGKMIVRNVARYRLRAGFTVLGVAISAALLMIGRFSTDALHFMIDFQFEVTQREDLRVGFESERGKGAWHDLRRMGHVRRVEPLLTYPFTARHGWREKDIGVTGLLPDTRMMRLLDTQRRDIVVDGAGLVLDERLAEELGVKPGDVVVLEPLMGRIEGERRVAVSRVVEQYFGTGAYMELHALSRLLEEPFAMNAALLQTEPGAARGVARELKDVPAVSSVTLKEDAFENLMDSLGASMRFSNVIVVVFASVIAFAIIYNSTSVSLMERRRELASLRVMGFTQGEVGRVLYQENILLSALGLALGIPLGLLLCRALVEAYETDLYRFPFRVSPGAFVYTVVFTSLFVLVANAAVHRQVKRLDLVEVLKARE